MRGAFSVVGLFLAFHCQAQIQVEKPWARATAPGSTVAGGYMVIRNNGAHLMFTEIKQPFKEGEKIPVTFRFEKAGAVSAEFHVRRVAASAPPAHQKH